MEIVMPQQGGSGGNSVPLFLAKLWKMVNDPSIDSLISWSAEGNSFIIHNQAEFTQTLLPHHYKHSNMASFVRQLNMYGFHKVVGVDSGGLKSERQEEMEFAHQFFLKGMEELLVKIKRKVSTGKAQQVAPVIKTEKVNEVLSEVSILRDKQADLDSKLDTMKNENEALWREVVNLRQKHQAQQKIVNKLIQFLVSIVQPRLGPVKRRYPTQLAIEDNLAKEAKLDDLGSAEGGFDLGPIIRDVTHETSTTDVSAVPLVLQQPDGTTVPLQIEMPDTPEPQVIVTSQPDNTAALNRPITPISSSGIMRAVNPSLVNPSISTSSSFQQSQPGTSMKLSNSNNQKDKLVKISPTRPTLKREISKEDFDLETTNLQKDLDNLKDILSGQITFDNNFITSLFNPEDSIPNFYSQPSGSKASYLNPGAASSSATNMPYQMTMPASNNGAESSNLEPGTVALIGEQPNLFDLANIDKDPMPPPETPVASAGNDSNSTNDYDDVTLNTPLVFADQVNPLTKQFQK